MHQQLTLTCFAALTLAIVLLRLLWPRLSPRIHKLLLTAACILLLLWPITMLTRWNTSSDRLNCLFYWGFVAAYELLLLLLTQFRPRWLTAIIAFTLIVPILSASAFLPLTEVFDRSPQPSIPLGDNLFSQIVPWNSPNPGYSGVDLEVYLRPRWLPFLQRRAQGARYYDSQCNAEAATATLLPDHNHLLMNCPALPKHPDSARTLIVHLY